MKEAISSPHAPKAIGPYSPVIRADGWVYVSGQVPIDPATGNLVQGDITAQTTQVMKNLKALLEAAGSGFDQVVKTTVYLKSMGDFNAMNEIYGRHFAAAGHGDVVHDLALVRVRLRDAHCGLLLFAGGYSAN